MNVAKHPIQTNRTWPHGIHTQRETYPNIHKGVTNKFSLSHRHTSLAEHKYSKSKRSHRTTHECHVSRDPDVPRDRLSIKTHNMETHHKTLFPTVTQCQKIGTLETFTYALSYPAKDTPAQHTIQRHHEIYKGTHIHNSHPGTESQI